MTSDPATNDAAAGNAETVTDDAVTDEVLLAVDDGVATITLHRPEVRNAINAGMRTGVRAAIERCEHDPGVAVMILTGTDPAFCAGLDLRELGSRPAEQLDDPDMGTRGSVSPFPDRTKPLIGAINGPAITGGFEFALNCDFLIASERAVFADTHARVGVMPGWGLSVLLADAVGVRRAREVSLSGNFVSAQEALTWGLVNRVVPHDELLPTTTRIAADIAGNDPNGVARMLATYREQEDTQLADGWRIESDGARAFRAEVGFAPDEIEARRASIIHRGRSQL
ncbi:MAG: enoyl-CoA hydratase [Acidimicrobiia bacterium]|nr:enoyl-CoA hydratase [Acidimicrobiia bacterium]